MRILALDLGTKTGFCYGNHPDTARLGTWTLAIPKEVTAWGKSRLTRRADPRICRLFTNIAAVGPIDAIVFEDVQFASSQLQAHLWAGLRSVLWLASCQSLCPTPECVPTGTLKKFATGHGGATKDMMAQAAARASRFQLGSGAVIDRNTMTVVDDNAIDAWHLHRWAFQHIAHLTP